jgi:tetratricopeptide (TPR) repeat protein
VVSVLSPKEKLQWAERHRQEGNTLYFKQQYKEAMDVYLTCLVALDKSPQNSSNEAGNIAYNNIDWEQKMEQQVKLPVLLNLSACTLKLGMLKKTCAFCDLALDLDIGKTSSKLYFRRGLAKASMGLYAEGKQDLTMSMDILRKQESDEASNDLVDKNEICKMKQAVEKEMLRLESLVVSAEKNHQRQTRAMKRILGGDKEAAVTPVTGETSINGSSTEILRNDVTKGDRRSANATSSEERLYNTVIAQRKYSTLRAPLQTNVQELKGGKNRNGTFVWYVKMAERSLRKILFWLGDENAMTKSFDDVEDLKNKSE